VAETAPLQVQLIAKTEFVAPPDVPWSTDADGGQALVEFAGRACYQSWSKPNPKTATNAAYLRHIIDVGHFSVLEHASVSFYITGISRSCTHELIRHRHFSYSQLSQCYVPEKESRVVVPPGIGVVYWRAQVGNWASRRVAGRCGFRMEGTVRGLLEQRGERRDAWIGSLRRGEPLTGQPDQPAHGD